MLARPTVPVLVVFFCFCFCFVFCIYIVLTIAVDLVIGKMFEDNKTKAAKFLSVLSLSDADG